MSSSSKIVRLVGLSNSVQAQVQTHGSDEPTNGVRNKLSRNTFQAIGRFKAGCHHFLVASRPVMGESILYNNEAMLNDGPKNFFFFFFYEI